MILADTTAWVEFDSATGSAVDQRMQELIGAGIPESSPVPGDAPESPAPADLCVTEPVMMEVLAGAASDRAEAELSRLLTWFRLLRLDPAGDFHAAARIYRLCRSEGVTPRGITDCLIAAVAWRTGAALLAQSRGAPGTRHRPRSAGPGGRCPARPGERRRLAFAPRIGLGVPVPAYGRLAIRLRLRV